jgi:hypothetical protein
MAFVAADRVKVSTTTTGTSAFGLSTATSAAFRSFSDASVPDGSTVHYAAYTATEFECGEGVYTAAGTTLSRDTIYASSNSNLIVNFGSSPTVIVGPLAESVVLKYAPELGADLDLAGFNLVDTGITVDFTNAAADAVFGWDDSVGTYENLTAAEVQAIISPLPVSNGGTGQTTEAEALGEMIQALTEDTAPIHSTDFVATYDASVDTGKKVLLNKIGMVLVAENQPTSDVATVTFTGLSNYSMIVVFFAVQLSNAGAYIDFAGATSGGTFRFAVSSQNVTAGVDDAFAGWAMISNFGIAATHKVSCSLTGTSSNSMDASNGEQGGSSDGQFGYSSFVEIWDELRLSASAGTIEGSASDQRGRISVYGVPK